MEAMENMEVPEVKAGEPWRTWSHRGPERTTVEVLSMV